MKNEKITEALEEYNRAVISNLLWATVLPFAPSWRFERRMKRLLRKTNYEENSKKMSNLRKLHRNKLQKEKERG